MKIGFPRAAFYYDYFPFWAGFFYALGVEVVLSSPTNRHIMEAGLKKSHDETCLPIKLLAGHINTFQDTGVDAIFLPRMVSMEESTYICPKFLGVPESVLKAVPEGIRVLTVTMNWRNGKKEAQKALEEFCLELGWSKANARQALAKGLEWQRLYDERRKAGWDFQESMAFSESRTGSGREQENTVRVSGRKNAAERAKLAQDGDGRKRPVIALVGHTYLTYESYANLNLLAKLRAKSDVRLVENFKREETDSFLAGLRKKMFWSHAKRILGAGYAYVDSEGVDGLIYLSCFGCGTDSITQDLLARKAREEHKPYMVLTLDEHSGEAGLVTRLEAFLDMVERRMVDESDFSSYGECLDSDSNAL